MPSRFGPAPAAATLGERLDTPSHLFEEWMMSLFDKAKDAISKNPDQAEKGVDKAADAAKSKFGDHADKVDQASDKAKDYLRKDGRPEGA
ncbi:antitoxin [Amycolatopsis magusensis]|nr:antitoxin [Amycolatopsis magusensis]